METLVKTTTEAMKEMMLLLKENKAPAPKTTDEEKKKKREEKRKKYNDAPVYKNCGKSIPPRRRMNAGSWRRTKTLALQHGSRRRAPEGARGL
jgi:hypothetical protein